MATKTFKKTILRAGQTYHSPDGEVKVTPERLKHWAEGFERLRAAKYDVPVSWDHATDINGLAPVKMLKNSAANSVGKLAEFKVAKDGQSAEIMLDLTDPKARGRARRNEVYVSPVIFESWKDGAKNEYKDVITHVDMVVHPVDYSQGPFEPIEPGTIACALRMGLSTAIYRLSKDDKPGDDEEDVSDDDTETINDESADADGDGDNDATDPPIDANKLKDVLATLQSMQIVLSQDTDESNFLDHLHQALLTAKALRGDDTNQPDAPDATGTAGGSTTVSDPGVATMSLESKAALAYAERQHRKEVQGRLDKLLETGRCTPAEHEQKKGGVGVLKLSLDKAGAPKIGDLEKWIESREPVPAGTFWDASKRTRMSATTVAEPPENMVGEMSKDRETELLSQYFGRTK